MAKTLNAILSKAQSVQLDRPRKLMLTTYAWMHLEEVYGSMEGALRGYAEMMTGHKRLTHAVNWLWALLQEEVRLGNKQRKPDEQETLTREDVEGMVNLAEVKDYQGRIAETITAYLPVPDPLKPVPVETNPGTGDGSTSSVQPLTAGTRTASWGQICANWIASCAATVREWAARTRRRPRPKS